MKDPHISAKISIYARVSTKDQTTENQLKDLRKYCKDRGFTVYKEYVDIDSGAKENRENFTRMMSDAHKRLFSVVLVWKLDRLSRSLKHLCNTLEILSSLNIDFICYNQNIDTTTPTGKLLFHIIGAFAEFERELIRERVKAGLRRAKDKGVKLGRKRVEANIYKLHQLRNSGMSYRKIADEIGISYASVFRLLQKPT